MSKPVRQRNKWRIRWIDENGVRQSAVYADYKEAQRELSRRMLEVDEIRRGVRTAPVEKTFADLADYWIDNRASQKRSGDHDKSIIARHLRPAFAELSLRRLGVEQVDRFVVDRAHLDPKTIHNHLTLFLASLRDAHRLGWLATLPPLPRPKAINVGGSMFRYLHRPALGHSLGPRPARRPSSQPR